MDRGKVYQQTSVKRTKRIDYRIPMTISLLCIINTCFGCLKFVSMTARTTVMQKVDIGNVRRQDGWNDSTLPKENIVLLLA